MDIRAVQVETPSQDFQSEQIIDLNDLALALVGGGVGEIAVG